MRQTKVASKLCIKCDRVRPLSEFYPNRDWRTQRYHDIWCKECVQSYCTSMNALRQYCYENNRHWQDSYWDSALKKAQYSMATNAEYLDPNTTRARKEELMVLAGCKSFLSMMNMKGIYRFVENVTKDGTFREESDELLEDSKKTRSYNKVWGGNFSKEELEKLEDTYAQYEEDFVLDNVSLRDYARKVAKASLNADIAEDRMRRGEASANEYKEAQRIFDDLSKSSNFAACKRKPGEASGMGSLGEIIMRIELDGKLHTNGFTFPEDDVDKIIHDFDHTLEAVGIEGVL